MGFSEPELLLEAQLLRSSAEIELQEQHLRTLHRDKSLLQRSLNAIRDPIARLPLELASKIFLECLPCQHSDFLTYHAPLLLLNICNTWTDIALYTTALWSGMDIVCPCEEDFPDLLELWLSRSSQRPLDLRLTIYDAVEERVAALIRAHSQRIQTLTVCLDSGEGNPDYPFDETEVDLLPCLRSLTISGSYGLHCSQARILQLLHRCPNLVELSLHSVDVLDFIPSIPSAVVLPRLRGFKFSQTPLEPPGEDGQIPPPALETRLPDDDGQCVPFSQPSSPPLRELIFDCMGVDYEQSLQPTVRQLSIRYPGTDLDFHVLASFALLAKEASTAVSMFPDLERLDLHLPVGFQFTDPLWDALISLLETRRPRLRLAHIFFNLSGEPLIMPSSPHIYAAVQELEAGGMSILFGQ